MYLSLEATSPFPRFFQLCIVMYGSLDRVESLWASPAIRSFGMFIGVLFAQLMFDETLWV